MKSNPSPWTITKPCSANWDKMRGDDKRRFCEHCQKHVHNVSAMNQSEREAFANPTNEKECVFYHQRRDGSVADLSLLVKFRQWFPFLRLAWWSILATLLPTLSGCMMGARCPAPSTVTPLRQNEKTTLIQTTNQPNTIDKPQ